MGFCGLVQREDRGDLGEGKFARFKTTRHLRHDLADVGMSVHHKRLDPVLLGDGLIRRRWQERGQDTAFRISPQSLRGTPRGA